MVAIDDRAGVRTYENCTWAERHWVAGVPLWLDGARWTCLALSERANRRIGVQPDRCSSCEYWRPRAENIIRLR